MSKATTIDIFSMTQASGAASVSVEGDAVLVAAGAESGQPVALTPYLAAGLAEQIQEAARVAQGESDE